LDDKAKLESKELDVREKEGGTRGLKEKLRRSEELKFKVRNERFVPQIEIMLVRSILRCITVSHSLWINKI
jgi:hypothetical protein